MDQLYVQTPVLKSTPLSKLTGMPVYLKMEALQPSGSFKDRGFGILISELASKGNRHFISASTGNAGLSLAHVCNTLNCTLKLVVPVHTSSLMIKKIELEGTEVIVSGNNFESANLLAREIALKENKFYVDPHNNPLIFEGISTMIYEVYGSGFKPGAILLSTDSGEILMGVLEGLNACKWQDIPIVIAETEDACSLVTELFAGDKKDSSKVYVPEIFEALKNHTVYPQIVTSKAALQAAKEFANDHRVLIDPKSAAALSLVYQSLPILKTYPSVLVIVNGGADVTLSTFS